MAIALKYSFNSRLLLRKRVARPPLIVLIVEKINYYLIFCLFVIICNRKSREGGSPASGSIPKCLQQMGLCQRELSIPSTTLRHVWVAQTPSHLYDIAKLCTF